MARGSGKPKMTNLFGEGGLLAGVRQGKAPRDANGKIIRKAPIRRVYGVRVDWEDGRTVWAVEQIAKSGAKGVAEAINTCIRHPDEFVGATATIVDRGPAAEFNNGETEAD